jgi:hypothetical protein
MDRLGLGALPVLGSMSAITSLRITNDRALLDRLPNIAYFSRASSCFVCFGFLFRRLMR